MPLEYATDDDTQQVYSQVDHGADRVFWGYKGKHLFYSGLPLLPRGFRINRAFSASASASVNPKAFLALSNNANTQSGAGRARAQAIMFGSVGNSDSAIETAANGLPNSTPDFTWAEAQYDRVNINTGLRWGATDRYEAKVTSSHWGNDSDATISDALLGEDTWYNLSETRRWAWELSTSGRSSGDVSVVLMFVSIRDSFDQTVVIDNAPIRFRVNWTT